MSFGINKYFIPSIAPGNVTDLTNKMTITMYGNTAKKYDAFPDDLIPDRNNSILGISLLKVMHMIRLRYVPLISINEMHIQATPR